MNGYLREYHKTEPCSPYIAFVVWGAWLGALFTIVGLISVAVGSDTWPLVTGAVLIVGAYLLNRYTRNTGGEAPNEHSSR